MFMNDNVITSDVAIVAPPSPARLRHRSRTRIIIEQNRNIRRAAEAGGAAPPAPSGGGEGGWSPGPEAIAAALGMSAAAPGGGLALGAVHELCAQAAADRGAAIGFAAALLIRRLVMPDAGGRPALVIGTRLGFREHGRLSGRGFAALGGDPGRLWLAAAERSREALWAAEEALSSGAPAAVLLLLASDGSWDLATSRRLQLAAARSRTPLIALPPAPSGASAARSRWLVAAAPSRPPAGDPHAPGRPCWRITLAKGWRERPVSWLVEWDDATLSCRLAAELADDPPSAGRAAARTAAGRLLRAAG
ncbi:MAG: hypothetical protein KatS3mg119_2356 [Rhodothalassiaceae bacterium]|nr:MAG: hypothetical protein KatS3mg119_2356 [Rhodothalassiaceae bacterium]